MGADVTTPYGEAAWSYRAAGWAGVLPLPVGAKTPPPGGFTGWAGVEPSGADVQSWIDDGFSVRGQRAPAGNIALRLPPGVYGLDVDDYGAKTGATALGLLVERCGPLPATWIVSSREESTSGIRLFRADVPPGRRWLNEPGGHGAGIESIHLGHRYAVVWPSVHPDTGRKYQWRRPDGLTAGDDELPRPDDLPVLPAAWVEALTELGEVRLGDIAGHEETVARVTSWRDGDPCPPVVRAAERARVALVGAAAGAPLHPAVVTATHELASLGHEGHAGVRRALAEHFVAATEVRAARGDDRGAAEAEWWRAVRGAIGKLAAADLRERCDCDLWAGAGLLFEPGPLPASTVDIDTRRPDEPETVVTQEPADLADVLIGRMIGPAELRDRPAPPWLVEGLLSLDSASWLIAAPASYKSFVALDWAGHVADGRPWMGRAVTRGGVVYMVAEGVGGMGPRIRAWEQRNGPMSSAVRFLPMPVQVGRADHWAAWVEACRRLDPAFVILDTQARITVGLDENDNTAMGEVVDALGRLQHATRACVLVVHHTGRSGGHARGASAIDGAQDTELKLTRTGDRRVVLEIDKSKNAADDIRVDLELFLTELDDGGTSLVVGEPLTAGAAAPWRDGLTDNQAMIMDVLHELFSERGATKSEIASVLRERGQRGEIKYIKSSFYLALDGLLKKDKIEQVPGTQRFAVVTAHA